MPPVFTCRRGEFHPELRAMGLTPRPVTVSTRLSCADARCGLVLRGGFQRARVRFVGLSKVDYESS